MYEYWMFFKDMQGRGWRGADAARPEQEPRGRAADAAGARAYRAPPAARKWRPD